MRKIPVELITWVAGLIYLSCVPPGNLSFCMFHILGFHYCPGCGLGHAIYFLFHGDWKQSINAHPLGVFVIGVLLHRIYILIKQSYFTFNKPAQP